MKIELTDMALRSECLGVLPPRLLQGHSPTGELPCTALVQKPRSSGEQLVNGSEPPAWLGLARAEAGDAKAPWQQKPRSRRGVIGVMCFVGRSIATTQRPEAFLIPASSFAANNSLCTRTIFSIGQFTFACLAFEFLVKVNITIAKLFRQF